MVGLPPGWSPTGEANGGSRKGTSPSWPYARVKIHSEEGLQPFGDGPLAGHFRAKQTAAARMGRPLAGRMLEFTFRT